MHKSDTKRRVEVRRICANLATLTRPSGGLSQRERRFLWFLPSGATVLSSALSKESSSTQNLRRL
jgi:hypothetical protein